MQRRANAGPEGLTPYLALLRAGFGQPMCLHTHRRVFGHATGALLPHHFTLARLAVGGMFLCHFPSGRPAWVLPSALPCGARTSRSRHSLGDGGRGRTAHSRDIVAHALDIRWVPTGRAIGASSGLSRWCMLWYNATHGLNSEGTGRRKADPWDSPRQPYSGVSRLALPRSPSFDGSCHQISGTRQRVSGSCLTLELPSIEVRGGRGERALGLV
jgi:hypothetical protein